MKTEFSLRSYARTRAKLLLTCTLGAVFLSSLFHSKIEQNSDGLCDALGKETHTHVLPEEIRWEPSRSFLSDFIWGRPVLFLARAASQGEGTIPSEPRDLYRAFVRVSPEGKMLSVSAVYNLTNTELGDEFGLVLKGNQAAYATSAFAQIQSVTVLDLEGEKELNVSETLVQKFMTAFTNLQQVGSVSGFGKWDLNFSTPARFLRLQLQENALVVHALEKEQSSSPEREFKLDLHHHTLVGPGTLEPERHIPKQVAHWLVDSVRALSFVGPAPIAWLEEKVFSVKDSAKRLAYKVSGEQNELANSQATEPTSAKSSESAFLWPPTNLASIWKTKEEGEGVWVLPAQTWVKSASGIPVFYRSYVKPDPERPYAKVLLVVMDGRQIELGMEGGSEDPKPLTGSPGKGRIPRDPTIYKRVAAAFNGGFKTEHGSYGMMVEGRVLLPPVPNAATVLTLKDGRFALGSWGKNHDVSGIKEVKSSEIVSFRQNLEALVDNGKLNPSGRNLWGFTLPGTSMQTERSGICVTGAGNLIYAWGDDVSALTLGKAMNMAGCIYGMHLDMNPHHTGFVFTDIAELPGKHYKSELLSNQMEISPDRYLEYAPKDFFYVMLRSSGSQDSAGFKPVSKDKLDAGSLPSAYEALPNLEKDPSLEVYKIDPSRFYTGLALGTDEARKLPSSKLGGNQSVPCTDKNAVLSVSMGLTSPRKPFGLKLANTTLYLSSAHGQSLFLIPSEEKKASLLGSKEDVKAFEHGFLLFQEDPSKGENAAQNHSVYAELPSLLTEGKPRTLGLETSALHNAFAMLPDGMMLLLHSSKGSPSKSFTDLFLRMNAQNALLLDRSEDSENSFQLSWQNKTGNLELSKKDTRLLFCPAPLAARGFRFEAEDPVPEPKKK